MGAHDAAQRGGGAERGKPQGGVAGGEEHCGGGQAAARHGDVGHVLARQAQRLAAQQAVQLAKGNRAACQHTCFEEIYCQYT